MCRRDGRRGARSAFVLLGLALALVLVAVGYKVYSPGGEEEGKEEGGCVSSHQLGGASGVIAL